MKLNLLLSVVSIFTVLHLCKAGPLRLQKRAAFYIANETACVVDNIVYSNGEPIPTDDPCESCKCRPPGFACVLQECKAKVGCRAVRRAGECCPDYVCGCEHNGKMYRDGDEIRDPKNPCYKCYCQGSSIACAFVDCFFRDDCDTEYLPGECCPKYTNCTGETPGRHPFTGGNALPPINLLPALNDDSVLPGDFPSSTQRQEPSEVSTNTTPSPQSAANNHETPAPESKEPVDVSSESPTAESKSSVNEESKLEPTVDEKDIEVAETTIDDQKDLAKEESKAAIEITDEMKTLFNTETGIRKDDTTEDIPVKDDVPQSAEEVVKEEQPQTTVINEMEETKNEADEEKMSPETESSSTEISESNQQIKNSASENSKSLKLSDDDDQSTDSEKEKQTEVDQSEKTDEKEIVSESATETHTVDDTSASSPTESILKSDENISSQTNPQPTSVDIVVHVKERTELSTEAEKVTTVAHSFEDRDTSPPQDLLKSNDELENTENKKEFSKVEEIVSTESGKNFETFPTSTEMKTVEQTTTSPLTDQNSHEEIEGRSDENDTLVSEAEAIPVSEEKLADSKDRENASTLATPDINDVPEVNQESRTNEEMMEEVKEVKPTEVKTDTIEPIKTDMTTDSMEEPSKAEEITKSENEAPEETKSEEIVSSAREEDLHSEEKVEATAVQNTESTTVVKVEESTSQTEDKLEERTEETQPQETANKSTGTENVEITEKEESKSEVTTESQYQRTDEPKQTETPSDKE